MHISEGVLSAPIIISGAVLTAAGVTVGLKKMKEEDIPKTAIISAALFIASLVHIPIGLTSVHLILNGIAGILLGWKIFPAFLIAAFLQSILFQFGGLTALGVNVLNVSLPAVITYYVFNLHQPRRNNKVYLGIISFICGALALFLTELMVAVSLIFTDQAFLEMIKFAIIANLPVMFVEGIMSMFIILFLKKVKTDLLEEV